MKNLIVKTLKEVGTTEMVIELFENNIVDEMVFNCVVNGVALSNNPQKAQMLEWLFK